MALTLTLLGITKVRKHITYKVLLIKSRVNTIYHFNYILTLNVKLLFSIEIKRVLFDELCFLYIKD